MALTTKQTQRFVKSVVIKFINGRPHLEPFRQDLEQEGFIRYINRLGSWVPGSKVSEAQWMFYEVWNSLKKYVDRKEKPHFRKPEDPEREGSPYWDLEDIPDIEELIDDEPPVLKRIELMEVLSGVELSERQQEFLNVYCELGELNDTADRMGISKQRAQMLFTQIVSNAKKANDLE